MKKYYINNNKEVIDSDAFVACGNDARKAMLEEFFDTITTINNPYAAYIMLNKYFVPQFKVNVNKDVREIALMANGLAELHDVMVFNVDDYENAEYYESIYHEERKKNGTTVPLDDAQMIFDIMSMDFIMFGNVPAWMENQKMLQAVEEKLNQEVFEQRQFFFPLVDGELENLKAYVQKINEVIL